MCQICMSYFLMLKGCPLKSREITSTLIWQFHINETVDHLLRIHCALKFKCMSFKAKGLLVHVSELVCIATFGFRSVSNYFNYTEYKSVLFRKLDICRKCLEEANATVID